MTSTQKPVNNRNGPDVHFKYDPREFDAMYIRTVTKKESFDDNKKGFYCYFSPISGVFC